MEYMRFKFKHRYEITRMFVCFLTRLTAEMSTARLKVKADKLDEEVKKLKREMAKSEAVNRVDNKVELIIRVNNM